VTGAVQQLRQLGAIGTVGSTKLTEVGLQMALFPLEPRFSKILLSAKDYGCLYVHLILDICLPSKGIFFIIYILSEIFLKQTNNNRKFLK
jgi:ATP-dependent RNA helicase DHX33